jgi:methyl-accepting chemotaxis protein
VSGLSYRLVSALVLAMLLLPLLAPFAGFVVPARAQSEIFTIKSVLAVPEALLGFYLNYTQARSVVGLTGLTLDFFISADGAAAIGARDVRVARVTVTVDTRDVFGTLKLPDNTTLFNLLGSSTGTLFVKVTDGFRVIVASVPFDLRASRLFEALKLSKTRLAFYNNTEFGVTSATNLTIDLRPYGLGITLGTFDYNVTRLVSEEHVYRLIEFNRTRGTYESDVATWKALNSYGNYFTVNFTRLNEFPLNNPERTATFLGVTFNYEDFILEYFAGVFENYKNAIKVDAGRQANTMPRDFTNEVEVRFSLAWPSTRTVDIFPSVAVTGVNRNAAGVTGELNVGDTITFALRNFPKNMWIFWEAWVYGATLSPRLYSVNITAISVTYMTGATGSASFTLSVRATQYGGRVIAYTFTTANATLGPFRGAPATNTTTNAVWREAIKPHVFIWSFDNVGAISTTRPIAPGSYVLVVGRGFIAEPLRFELVRQADGVRLADLTMRRMIGVLDNGSFAAIVQLPVETLPPTLDGTSVYVVARGTVTETNVGRTANIVPPGTATLTLRYNGLAAAVYINPDPRAVSVSSFGANRIVLGGDVFPHAAVWEPVERRTITVEAIGLNIAQAVRAVNVTFISIDPTTPGLTYRANATLALNEPVTFGYFRKTYPVPTLPHTPSGYQVRVFNRTTLIGESQSLRLYAARINATIAVIDPADGVPRKAVTLASIQDVEVVGFGWAARLDARHDVQPIAFAVNIPLATSGVDGSLRGTVRLPLYVTQPGSYRILVYQDETRVSPSIRLSSFADVSVGVLPAFTIKLMTSAIKLADLPIDVWVVAYFGGSVASVGQVVSVTVDAIARGVGTARIALAPEPQAGTRAVFYGSLDLVRTFGDAVKGKEVLLSATAVGRYTAGAPLQEAYDVAVVSVPPATISDILSAITLGFEIIDNFVVQLTAISDKLDTLSTALGSAVTTIRGDIAGVRTLLLEVNTNVGLVANAVLTVADQNEAILARLSDMDAKLTGVSSGVAKISTDVDGLATLIRSANLSIARVVTDQAGRVVAALSDSEGRIVGAISTNAKTLSDLITASEGRVRGDVKAVSDALAAFQSGAFSKLDAIASSVDTVRADVSRLRTDATATANVVVGIQTAVNKIDTNVGGLVDTAKTIATTVDSINKAVPGLATKADVSGAQTAITGAIDKAKSDLQSAVKSAEDAASTSSRNWGVINAILVFIAIAVLAYSTFVARRA